MIWATDYDSGEGSGTTPRGGDDSEGFGFIYLDPSIWRDPQPSFSCEAPCNVALPPHPLLAQTTISVAGAAIRSFIIPGVANGAKVTKTIITTVSYPPVTTSQISLFPMGVLDGKRDNQALTAHASIDVAPIAVTLDMGTVTPVHTRSATLKDGTWFVTKLLLPDHQAQIMVLCFQFGGVKIPLDHCARTSTTVLVSERNVGKTRLTATDLTDCPV